MQLLTCVCLMWHLQGHRQQQQQQEQLQPVLSSRPTLADIHSTTSVQLSVRGDTQDSGSIGGWDWQALGLDDDDDDDPQQQQQQQQQPGDASSQQQPSSSIGQASPEQQQQHPLLSQLGQLRRKSSEAGTPAVSPRASSSQAEQDAETLTGGSSSSGSKSELDDISVLDAEFGVQQQQQHDEHRLRRRLLRFGRQQRRLEQQQRQQQRRSARNQRERALHVSVRVQLGQQRPHSLRAVPLRPDGTADVCQAAVFAVSRPLDEAPITYELGLGLGPRGAPLLSLTFQYSLLHLLRRSPARPVTWQEWRLVARCNVSGLQVSRRGWLFRPCSLQCSVRSCVGQSV
jgi:hypothetical protein